MIRRVRFSSGASFVIKREAELIMWVGVRWKVVVVVMLRCGCARNLTLYRIWPLTLNPALTTINAV